MRAGSDCAGVGGGGASLSCSEADVPEGRWGAQRDAPAGRVVRRGRTAQPGGTGDRLTLPAASLGTVRLGARSWITSGTATFAGRSPDPAPLRRQVRHPAAGG